MEIISELQKIFRDVFDDENLVITAETSAKDIEDWDSLTNITLVVAIQKHFGIKFAFEDLKDLKNVGDMAALIGRKLERK